MTIEIPVIVIFEVHTLPVFRSTQRSLVVSARHQGKREEMGNLNVTHLV